jgi:membrane protease YdiL (CAAX protease family)
MKLIFSVLIAYAIWFFLFRVEIFNFWIRLLVSSTILLIIALLNFKKIIKIYKPNLKFLKPLFIGLLTGCIFYLLLYAGFYTFKESVYEDAKSVYNLAAEFEPSIIFIILLFTSSCEEIFWRGYVQNSLLNSYGCYKAALLTALIYSSVHVSSLNISLMFIALIMGILWGFLYNWSKSLLAVITSHITWTELVFVILPLT